MEPYYSSFQSVPYKQSLVGTAVGPIPNGSEHIRSSVNVASENIPSDMLKNLLESFG